MRSQHSFWALNNQTFTIKINVNILCSNRTSRYGKLIYILVRNKWWKVGCELTKPNSGTGKYILLWNDYPGTKWLA